MDRSTRATLSTYNAWIHVSRLQKIYQPHCPILQKPAQPVSAGAGGMQLKKTCSYCHVAEGLWTTLLSQHGFRLRGVQS